MKTPKVFSPLDESFNKLVFNKLIEEFTALNTWDTTTIHNAIVETETKTDAKVDLQLLRVLTSGAAGGPAIHDMLVLLGKEEVIKRLNAALEILNSNS